MRLTILGPQGSGKTTQARKLAEKLNLPIIDIGQIIRNYCTATENVEGADCSLMKKGELVSNELAASLLKNLLANPTYDKGFILDGYPRTLEQLKVYDPQLNKVIFISLSDDVSKERLAIRNRLDDTSEGIKRRLAWHHENTNEILDYFRDRKMLIVVNGHNTEEKVFEDILSFLYS